MWSNKNAVFALISSECYSDDHSICNTGNATTVRLYKNDGSAWSLLYQTVDVPETASITGYPDGRVVLASDAKCSVLTVNVDGSTSCIWSDKPVFPIGVAISGTQNLFLLGKYDDDATTTLLFEHDGTRWSTVKTWGTDAPNSIAANATKVLIAGPNQLAEALDISSGQLSTLPAVPAGDYSATWMFAANDLLLGDAAGRLNHYDGSKWITVDSNLNDVLNGIWGAADGTAFTFAQAGLARWKSGVVDTIFNHQANVFPSHYFVSIWGNTATEVFLAVNDNNFSPYACGVTFLVWFDGVTFHAF